MQRSAPFLFPYRSRHDSLQTGGGTPKVLTTEAVMAWKNMGISTILFFAFVFTACGGDSENRISNGSPNQTPQGDINYTGITYKTYDGLVSELPCELSLNLTIAHVSSTNEDYLCSQDVPSGLWSWQPYYGGNGFVIGDDGRVYETFIDSRDGHVYKKVNIGTQTWMAENLDFATEQSRCFKGNSGFEDCGRKGIGRYYTWPDAMDSAGVYSKDGLGCGYLPNYQAEKCAAVMSQKTVRGICPQGWHLPDTTEWNTLLNYVGNPPIKLVKRELMYFKGATDTYGFSAIPTGYWSDNSCYECYESLTGDHIYFWASTPFVHDKSTDKSYYEFEFGGSPNHSNWSAIMYFNRSPTVASYAIPVRCIMDRDNGLVTSTIQSSSSNSLSESAYSSLAISSSSFSVQYSSSVMVVESCKTAEEDHCEYGSIIDGRDDQIYKTVKIGTQIWMAQNLNYKIENSFCYDDDESNCSKYGRLYTWAMAVDSIGVFSLNGRNCGYNKTCVLEEPVRGICPEGWHLPSMSEYTALFEAVGGQPWAGSKLKTKEGWNNKAGRDAYGFSALSAGYRNDFGAFDSIGEETFFWCSSESNIIRGTAVSISYGVSRPTMGGVLKNYGLSIRCVKN